MVYLISSKLDAVTRRKWESSITANEPPTFNQFTEFLTKYCAVLETLQPSKPAISKTQTERKQKKSEQSTSCASVKGTSKTCSICKGEHMIYNCASFKELSVDERLNEVKRNRLCFNCLRDNHPVERCMAGGCKRCSKKHNTMLHFDQPRLKANNDQSSTERGNVSSDSRDNCSNDQSNQIHIIAVCN